MSFDKYCIEYAHSFCPWTIKRISELITFQKWLIISYLGDEKKSAMLSQSSRVYIERESEQIDGARKD